MGLVRQLLSEAIASTQQTQAPPAAAPRAAPAAPAAAPAAPPAPPVGGKDVGRGSDDNGVKE